MCFFFWVGVGVECGGCGQAFVALFLLRLSCGHDFNSQIDLNNGSTHNNASRTSRVRSRRRMCEECMPTRIGIGASRMPKMVRGRTGMSIYQHNASEIEERAERVVAARTFFRFLF